MASETTTAAPFPPLTPAPTPTSIVKRLYLCRHGETKFNAMSVLQGSGIDASLNETGIFQAECLRDCLANLPIDLFISSGLKRAEETAQIVRQKHPQTKLVKVNELAEINWGDWEGNSNPALAGLLSSWVDGNHSARAPNGESPLEAEARSMPSFYDIIMNRPEKDIVFVVHGRLLRIMLSSMLYQTLNHMNSFTHHNTCINLIDIIIETDPSLAQGHISVNMDRLKNGNPGSATRLSPSLDDNVNLSETPILPTPPPLRSTLSDGSGSATLPTATSPIWHPPNLTVCPLLFDYRNHLPPHLRG